MSYHDRPERSSTEIAAYLSDPIQWFHWYVAKDWARPEPTKPMKLGTSVHDMIEVSLPLMVARGGWDSIVKEIPASVLNADGHCKGKLWTTWKDDNPCDIYFKPGEPNPLRTVWDHLNANDWCRERIERGNKEVEHIWDDSLLGPCRIKMDLEYQGEMGDWKTTKCKTAQAFARDAGDRFYDVRLALYCRGYQDKFGERPRTYVIAIQNSGGMKVTPYRLDEDWLEDAEARLIETVYEMQTFNIERYLNNQPEIIYQPKHSTRFNPENQEAYA